MWIYLFLQLGGFRVKSRLITFNNERSQLIFLFDNFVYFFLKNPSKREKEKGEFVKRTKKYDWKLFWDLASFRELKILKDLFKARE